MHGARAPLPCCSAALRTPPHAAAALPLEAPPCSYAQLNLTNVAQDQYLEVSTHVSRGAYIYGAGERASETLQMTVRPRRLHVGPPCALHCL